VVLFATGDFILAKLVQVENMELGDIGSNFRHRYRPFPGRKILGLYLVEHGLVILEKQP
jgi:hypothetical protein